MDDTTAPMHPAVDAVVEALAEKIGGYEIPENGVLDVDALIGSIPALMTGIGDALRALAENGFGESPVHSSVTEMLAEFSAAVTGMGGDAVGVHNQWAQNPDNAHDLARARGEIANAGLFDVGAA